MTVVLRLHTRLFDVSREPENPINPIPGASLLLWLRDRLRPDHELTEPEPEDWGWEAHVEWDGVSYMLGASASEPEAGESEWILQIVRARSFKERLLGRAKATRTDACVMQIFKVLAAEPGFREVQIEEAA